MKKKKNLNRKGRTPSALQASYLHLPMAFDNKKNKGTRS